MLYPSVKTTPAADQSKIQSRAVLSSVYRLLTGQLSPKRAQQSGPIKEKIYLSPNLVWSSPIQPVLCGDVYQSSEINQMNLVSICWQLCCPFEFNQDLCSTLLQNCLHFGSPVQGNRSSSVQGKSSPH